MASKYVPVVGKQFGLYEIVDKELHYHKDSKAAYYKVRCNGCNEVYVREAKNLENGKSTGCKKCLHRKQQEKDYPKLGTKFGFYTVIDGDKYKFRCEAHLVHVQCSCGKEQYVYRYSLERGKAKHCKDCTQIYNRKGVGDVSGSYFVSIQNGATSRKFEFSITINEIWDLFLQQKAKCAISGVSIVLNPFWGSRVYKKDQTASLDRIDSTKGYILSNVQWVHKDVNYMKQELDETKFLNWCKIITQYNDTSREAKGS